MSKNISILKQFEALDDVGEARAKQLVKLGFDTMAKLAKADPKDIAELSGVSDEMAASIVAEAVGNAADDDAGVRFKLNASVTGLEAGKTYTKKAIEAKQAGLFGTLKKLHALERVG